MNKQPSDINTVEFPRTDGVRGKLRPVLLITQVPGKFDDWLLCMITSQTRHQVDGFDELIGPNDDDFEQSGLKTKSLIRITRLAVLQPSMLEGRLGKISEERLRRIRQNLGNWLKKEL